MQLESKFEFGDRVHVDGDQSLTGTVTAVSFRPASHDGKVWQYVTAEVSYVHNGTSQVVWFEEWRLSSAGRTR